jgi:GNAT superfamily N-acetyltransferase
MHPLARLITDAAKGRFPPADGGWHRVSPWRPGLAASVAFTAHAVLAIDGGIDDARLIELGVNGMGGAHDPRLINALAGPDGWIDSLDLVLVARGTGRPGRLVDRPDLAGHPRARYAAEIRSVSRVLGYPAAERAAVAIIARGLGGLTELSFELEPERRGAGTGAALIRDALDAIPAGELVVACAAPGNAASLRSLLSSGFAPVAAVQLFRSVPVPPHTAGIP